MKKREYMDSMEDLCGHTWEAVSYDAAIDRDPEGPLHGVPGPWVLLRCRVCRELEIRVYHPGYRVRYEVIPYLLDEQTPSTSDQAQRIHQFIHDHPDLVRTVIRGEIDRARDCHETHIRLAQRAYDRAIRLQTILDDDSYEYKRLPSD